MLKTCSICGVKYQPDEKIKNRNWCRECLRKYHRDYAKKRRKNSKILKRERQQSRDYYNRKYKDGSEFKLKKLARRRFLYAVQNGNIIRPDRCSACNKKCDPDGHHEDYSRPLEVTWLCEECHSMRHRTK